MEEELLEDARPIFAGDGQEAACLLSKMDRNRRGLGQRQIDEGTAFGLALEGISAAEVARTMAAQG